MSKTYTGADGLEIVIQILKAHKKKLRNYNWADALTFAGLDAAIAALKYLKVKDINILKEEIIVEES